METIKKTFKTSPNSAYILWFLLSYGALIYFLYKPIFNAIDNYEILSVYYRIGVNVVLNSILAIGFKGIYSILKTTRNSEFNMDILDSDGFRIIFFKKCAKFYDKISESLLEVIHFLMKEKILVVVLWLLLSANIIWALMSPHFFNIVLAIQIVCILSHAIIFGLVYWSINATYNLYKYCVYYNQTWSPKIIEQAGKKFKKEVSLENILNKVFDFLRQNSFAKVLGYVKKFDLFSACASLAFTLISYIVLLFEKPFKAILRLFNTKYVFFLIDPLVSAIKGLIWVINMLINAFYIWVASLYSVSMVLFSLISGLIFFNLSHLILSFSSTSLIEIGIVLAYYFVWVSIWAMITYSIFYQLLDSYNPMKIKKRLDSLDDEFKNTRNKSHTSSYWFGFMALNICLYVSLVVLFKNPIIDGITKGNKFIVDTKKELIFVSENATKIVNDINKKIEKDKKMEIRYDGI